MTSIGMNLAGLNYYTLSEPFIDRFKTSGGWQSRDSSGNWLNVQTDGLGNPLPVSGTTLMSTLVGVDFLSEPTTDIYVLTYSGTATFSFNGGKVLSAMPGKVTYELTLADLNAIQITASNLNAADPLHDIHFVRQDQVTAFNAGEIFNPAFLAKTAQWDIIRGMDWLNTNASLPVSWADRATERDASWASDQSPDGVPIEILVKLANKTHSDLWYNVPTRADDTYVRSALALIRDTLDPSLKVHVEYSNEVWNWGFKAAYYAREQAASLWGVDANKDGTINVNDPAEVPNAPNLVYYGYRSAQVAKIAHDVFGTAGAARVIDVLGVQAGSTASGTYILGGVARANVGTTSSLFSEYAVTTYFTMPTDTATDRETILGWARSGAAGMTAAFRELESGGGLSTDYSLKAVASWYAQQQSVIAKPNGLSLVAYEGGAHLAPAGFSASDTIEVTAFFGKLMEDPRMGTLYKKMVDDFSAAGGKSLVAYNDVGTNSKYGWWGVLDTIYDNGSPRYDALVTASLQSGRTVPTFTTPTTTPATPAIANYALGTGRANMSVEGGGTVTMSASGFAIGDSANARTMILSSGGLPGDVTVTLPAGSLGFQLDPGDGSSLKLSATVATISGPIATIEATNAAGQTLTITGSEAHKIIGAAGADKLIASTGHDVIMGGAGSDTIDGGAGNDHLYGQSPNGGTDGADSISGGEGADYIQGNAGADTLDGGAGSDRIFGGADNDSITGGTGNDTINGNLGDDSIWGGADSDSIRGGQGNDLIYGDAGDDTIGGDLGNDTLIGGTGLDRMTGGDGADIFRFTPGDARYLSSDEAWLTDVVTDFVPGTDKLALGFSVTTVLIGAAQINLPAAVNAAQVALNSHPGDNEVAAVAVGGDIVLFFSGTGGAIVDSAIRLIGVSSLPALSDFI